MTQEEKAKCYDEIIKKANKMHSENCEACQICIEELIPELAESEDEKIREQIVYAINQLHVCECTKNKLRAWLEKQGETFTKKDIDDAYLKGVCDTKHELEKQDEQKPAWSEGDESIALGIEQLCNCADLLMTAPDKIDKIRNWLKSLRPQNTWKPTELQMDVLLDEVTAWTKGCPKQKVLESLYQDLKKLREE